jgi:hypothetical protein
VGATINEVKTEEYQETTLDNEPSVIDDRWEA